MSEKVILELPEELAQRARTAAARTQRPLEEVLVEWIDRAGAEPAVELLPDDELVALCDLQMETGQQEELSDLLAGSREGQLSSVDRHRLDELMHIYRRGLVRKAQAMRVAVARGLKPRLD